MVMVLVTVLMCEHEKCDLFYCKIPSKSTVPEPSASISSIIKSKSPGGILSSSSCKMSRKTSTVMYPLAANTSITCYTFEFNKKMKKIEWKKKNVINECSASKCSYIQIGSPNGMYFSSLQHSIALHRTAHCTLHHFIGMCVFKCY